MPNDIALQLLIAIVEGITIGLCCGGAALIICNSAVRLWRSYAKSRGVVGIERTGGASAASAAVSSLAGSSP